MGQEAADLAISAGWRILGFVDDDPELEGHSILGLPVLGNRAWLEGQRLSVAVAVGSPVARRKALAELATLGVVDTPPLIHRTAHIGLGCTVGQGSIIAAGATLTADVQIGSFVIVNAGATVSHNSRLDDFATVAPGARLAGSTTVREGADIGIGAALIQGLTIGEWSIIGAGAAVIHDVAPNTTVVGCPGRVTSTRPPGWHT